MEMNKKDNNATLAMSVIPGKSMRNDFPLYPKRCALLIIDIQDYLSTPSCDEHGQSHHTFFDTALVRTTENIKKLLPAFRARRDQQSSGCEVIFTYLEAMTKDCRDVSLDYKLSGPKLASIPNRATNPAKFLDNVAPSDEGKGDILLPKTSCSVFMSTNLMYILRNLFVEQLVITGQLTEQCVESAVRDAADLGFFVTVVEDACAAMSQEAHERGLSGMKGFCRIVDTQTILKELSEE